MCIPTGMSSTVIFWMISTSAEPQRMWVNFWIQRHIRVFTFNVPELWRCIRLTCGPIHTWIKASGARVWISATHHVSTDYPGNLRTTLLCCKQCPWTKVKGMGRNRLGWLLSPRKEYLWENVSKHMLRFKKFLIKKYLGSWYMNT